MLIAEISNMHMGNLKDAKELIRVAHNSGADLIKGQAFKAEDIKTGSMSNEFYKQCEFSIEQYEELIDYACSIGTTMFYSIFSKSLMNLMNKQKYLKLAGGIVRLGEYNKETYDVEFSFVSVPKDIEYPDFDYARMLYVSDYLEKDPDLETIFDMHKHYKRLCGYSDHTVGIEACIRAIKKYDAVIIEKHFKLDPNQKHFNGQIYRDSIHAATPNELEKLAGELNLEIYKDYGMDA